jgi:predicted MPP superfamily phosphohydrolase
MATEPPVLRWLHLTDLHMGKDSEPQRIAVTSLLNAIEEQAKDVPFDLVLLTGDLVNSGKLLEFEQLRLVLIEPLRQSTLFQNATFLSVPGNHDLDCDVGVPLTWSGLGEIRQTNFFNFDTKGSTLRNSRAAAFKEYANFLTNNNVLGVDPLNAPAQTHSLEVRGKKIELICLVTAFFSDREKSATDHHKAPMPVQPIRSLLQKRSSEVIPLILGHHPSTWFLHETSEHFHSLLVDESALYLHGHEHTVIVRLLAELTRSI